LRVIDEVKDVKSMSEKTRILDASTFSSKFQITLTKKVREVFDIHQPDVVLGDINITGIRKIAVIADYFGRMVVSHGCSAGSVALSLPAALQAVATLENCPMIEYPFDPPILTAENQQLILKEAISIDKDGFLEVPYKPGLGIEIDEEKIGV